MVGRRTELRARLRAQADALYKASDDAGVVVSQSKFSAMIDSLRRTAEGAGVNKGLHPKADALIKAMKELKGGQPSPREIDQLRQQLGDVAGSIDKGEARIGAMLIDDLDQAIRSLAQKDLVAGDSKAALAAMVEARDLWRRMRNTETMERALVIAEDQAQPIAAALKGQVRTLLRNRKFLRGITKVEELALRRVVRAGTAEDVLTKFGAARLLVVGLSSGLGSLAGGFGGGAIGGALGVTGIEAARGVTGVMTRSRLMGARDTLSRGAAIPRPTGGAVRAVPTGAGVAAGQEEER